MTSLKEEWKAAIERIHLDSFLASMKWNVTSVNKCRSPDFVVVVDGKRLGIEICRIFKDHAPSGSTLKTNEVKRAKFLKSLADSYYSRGGKPIRVNVLVKSLRPVDSSKIIEVLMAKTPSVIWKENIVSIKLADGPAKFFIKRVPDEFNNYSRWYCVSDSCGWVRCINSDEIQKRIAKHVEQL